VDLETLAFFDEGGGGGGESLSTLGLLVLAILIGE